MKLAERNRAIKKALTAKYGNKNVKVIGGRGTATGWIDIRIEQSKPQHEEIMNEWGRCKACNELSRAEVLKVKEIARQASAKIGGRIYTYTDDMNYDHEEMLVDVEYI